jgi:hypothetical protein
LIHGNVPVLAYARDSVHGRLHKRQMVVRDKPILHIDGLPATVFIRGMFKAANAVQIRVSIDELDPEVWRQLVLPVHWNLEHLHLSIQAAFKWWNYHLYEFRIGGLRDPAVECLRKSGGDQYLKLNSPVFHS